MPTDKCSSGSFISAQAPNLVAARLGHLSSGRRVAKQRLNQPTGMPLGSSHLAWGWVWLDCTPNTQWGGRPVRRWRDSASTKCPPKDAHASDPDNTSSTLHSSLHIKRRSLVDGPEYGHGPRWVSNALIAKEAWMQHRATCLKGALTIWCNLASGTRGICAPQHLYVLAGMTPSRLHSPGAAGPGNTPVKTPQGSCSQAR